MVELPYSDDKYNMYIFMPEKGKLDLSFMESIINQETIPAFKEHYLQHTTRPLRVVLPKFKISSEIDISRSVRWENCGFSFGNIEYTRSI